MKTALQRLSAGRAVFGMTTLALGNPAWEVACRHILIVRLSPFRDVDRSSPHLILFSEARAALPEAFIDFSFMPTRADRELLDAAGEPWFFGAASGRSPADFGLILVSNAFGLELVNLPRLLSTAGIPLLASARAGGREGGEWPLTILGGSNAGQCGALADAAGDSLVDGLFFGEGEGAIGPLAVHLSNYDIQRGRRLELAAASIEGFWPALRPDLAVKRRVLGESPPPLVDWPPFDSPEAGTARLQITAGCPGHCSFCFEGWDRLPYRELPLDSVIAAARSIKTRTGAETLEAYSFNFNTHASVFALLYELGRIFKTVNFMSQRLDVLAGTRGLMEAELAADKRSFTLGIEGISARMRAYYRKGLSEAELADLVRTVVTRGVRELKLFYIIAGIEDEEDFADFARFAADLASSRAEAAPGLRILASAGYLVRLPGTPLAYSALALEEAPLASIAARLGAICEEHGLEWRLAAHFDEYSADQVISLAGGVLLPWLSGLATASRDQVYDGSLGKGIWKSLEAYCRSHSVLSGAFLSEKARGEAPLLPMLDYGRSREALWKEWLAAKAFQDRVTCLGGSCSGCGACESAAERLFLTGHEILPPAKDTIDRIARLVAAKRLFARMAVGVERPATLSGAAAPAQEAWLMRTLCGAGGSGWKTVYSAKLVLPRPGEAFGMPEGASGWSVFEVEGPDALAMAVLAKKAGFLPLPAVPAPPLLTIKMIPGRGAREETAGLRATLGQWLGEGHLAFTGTRSGEDWLFTVTRRDRTRQSAVELRLLSRAGGYDVLVETGPKADLESLWKSLGGPLCATIVRQGPEGR
ncbi:MAG: B12-binding domain-containing radical SAM protein [Rectinemataceae bacterium]